MSVSTAREMVGQPHLADHDWIRQLASVEAGPVHLIACLKSVTEAQATRMLGFPNAVVGGIAGAATRISLQQPIARELTCGCCRFSPVCPWKRNLSAARRSPSRLPRWASPI